MRYLVLALLALALTGCASAPHRRAWIIAGSVIAAGAIAAHADGSPTETHERRHLPAMPPREQAR